jgi:aconitate hydratase
VACPHSPDKVVPVFSLRGIGVNQIVIGSCTDSSYADLKKVAKILKEGKEVTLILEAVQEQQNIPRLS